MWFAFIVPFLNENIVCVWLYCPCPSFVVCWVYEKKIPTRSFNLQVSTSRRAVSGPNVDPVFQIFDGHFRSLGMGVKVFYM